MANCKSDPSTLQASSKSEMKSLVLALAWFSTITAVSATGDESLQFVPARFHSGDESINATMQCPVSPPGANLVTVFCQARINPEGSANHSFTHCFSERLVEAPHVDEVERAVRRSKFLPAMIDGVPVSVFFSFRVILLYDINACKVVKIPNMGFQTDKFGNAYIAPQEILANQGWHSRSRALSRETKSVERSKTGVMFHMSIDVSAAADVGTARLENNNFATREEIRSALSAIEKSEFIPGFFDGVPHSMRYFEIYYVRRYSSGR